MSLKQRSRAKRTDVFTTGEVAKICKVAPRTTSKWFDSGRLKGYRIPGSNDRRIPREHLIRFLKDHHMPLGDLEAEVLTHVLLVGADAHIEARLRDLLPPAADFRLEAVASAFDAGVALGDFAPDVIVIDLSLGRATGAEIARRVRGVAADGDCPLLLALAGEDEADPDAMKACGFDDVFKKPFDAALLAERVRRVAAEKD